MQVRAAVTKRLARHVVALNQRHHLTHFAAVRARVHVHTAANRPRNAAGEGQSAKVAVRRRHRQARHHRARLCANAVAVHFHTAQIAANANHQSADTAAAHEKIAAIADDRNRHVQFPRGLNQQRNLRWVVRICHQICRAAQMQRRITRHIRVFFQLEGGRGVFQPERQFTQSAFTHVHSSLSYFTRFFLSPQDGTSLSPVISMRFRR